MREILKIGVMIFFLLLVSCQVPAPIKNDEITEVYVT